MSKVYNPKDIEVTIKGRKVKPCADYSVKEPRVVEVDVGEYRAFPYSDSTSSEVLRTSAEWKHLLAPKTIICDPDGWDRTDYDYSFNGELISEEEFNCRLQKSSVLLGGFLSRRPEK